MKMVKKTVIAMLIASAGFVYAEENVDTAVAQASVEEVQPIPVEIPETKADASEEIKPETHVIEGEELEEEMSDEEAADLEKFLSELQAEMEQ